LNFPQEIPEQKAWKYAQTEWERSFLLHAPPFDIKHLRSKQIEDRYLKNSQIRLRQTFDGKTKTYKLSKKVVLGKQTQRWISTIYLNENEYELFAQLPAFFLKKNRHYYDKGDTETIGIDHIVLGEKEIWLAEVEFSSETDLRAYTFPFPFIREISEEVEFSGFEMARVFSDFSP